MKFSFSYIIYVAKFYTKSLHMETYVFEIQKTDNCSLHYLTHIVAKTVVIFYSCYPNDSYDFYNYSPETLCYNVANVYTALKWTL